MREIKFRGKRIDSGEWVYGDLVHLQEGKMLIFFKPIRYGYMATEHFYFEVGPKTIGEFTGLKDRNGKEIYEGDVVQCEIFSEGYVKYSVFWLDELGSYGLMPIFSKLNKGEILFSIGVEALEVIGNIYDNSELIEKGE